MTVGELRALLDRCADDAPVLAWDDKAQRARLWDGGARVTLASRRKDAAGIWSLEDPRDGGTGAPVLLVLR